MLGPNSQHFYVDSEKSFSTAQVMGKTTNGHNNVLNDIEGTRRILAFLQNVTVALKNKRKLIPFPFLIVIF